LARAAREVAGRRTQARRISRRRRGDFFRIRQFRRTYDRAEDRFTFNVCYETRSQLTPRSLVVAEAFGLGVDEAEKFTVLDAELKIRPSDVVYVTGDSGSGKSVLLRALRQDLGSEAVDISEVDIDVDKPLIETVGASVEEGLELLSKVGLNDAFLFLRTYSQLSDGQKYRYRIAKLIESGKQWWLMDEFAACLDRDTAKIVAFNLQKLARSQGKAVIAATTHNDFWRIWRLTFWWRSVLAKRSRYPIFLKRVLGSAVWLKRCVLRLAAWLIGVACAAFIIGVMGFRLLAKSSG
jgi:ABC-type transport system involved in cytochrome c biogenesis ATPase subunit